MGKQQPPTDQAVVRAALEAEHETLRAEHAVLRERVKQLEAQVAERDARVHVLEEHLGAATTRVAELEQSGQRRRKFGKAAAPKGLAKPQKVRAAAQNRG